jgi:molybdopterin synthase sulfur carrier subunit
MRIKVRGYLTLRAIIGGEPFRIVEAERLTVLGLLQRLSQDLGEELAPSGGIRPTLAVLVNGRHVSHLPEGLQTQLEDGDEVSIFPPTAGGA